MYLEIVDHGYASYVTDEECTACVMSGYHIGCCGFHSTWKIGELAHLLRHEDEEFIRHLWQSRKYRLEFHHEQHEVQVFRRQGLDDKCLFHNARQGCLLNDNQRPLFCRFYICHAIPDQVLVKRHQSLRRHWEDYAEHISEAMLQMEPNLSGVTFKQLRQVCLALNSDLFVD